LTWKAATPPGTNLTVSVRTGNVADPDDTWSDWSSEYTDSEKTAITAPTARFVQYRVTLSSANPKATPELHRLALRYKTTNQAPEITSFDVPDLVSGPLVNKKKKKPKCSGTNPADDHFVYTPRVRKDR